MKVKVLKNIRKESWEKYEVRKCDAVNAGDKPWCIWTGPKSYLAYHEYATREEAINAAKLLWHDHDEKVLWELRSKRKRNKYPY